MKFLLLSAIFITLPLVLSAAGTNPPGLHFYSDPLCSTEIVVPGSTLPYLPLNNTINPTEAILFPDPAVEPPLCLALKCVYSASWVWTSNAPSHYSPKSQSILGITNHSPADETGSCPSSLDYGASPQYDLTCFQWPFGQTTIWAATDCFGLIPTFSPLPSTTSSSSTGSTSSSTGSTSGLSQQ